MTVIFGILGILCLIYYGVIVIYSGAGTSFSAIWIVLALGFFIMAAVGKFYPRIRDRVPVQIEVAVITFFSAIAFIFIVVELLMGFGALSFQKESVNYVIVLGAHAGAASGKGCGVRGISSEHGICAFRRTGG